MITISKVSKWYGTMQVLKNCSTEVAKGEVVVVCGPSGSGKSTLIKCVNGLEPFEEGTITVDGISVGDRKTNLPKLRARIGMVFQHFELFPHLSVMRNLSLAQVKVLGRDSKTADEKGRKLLERVGLTSHGKIPRSTVRRPAAARRHRAGAGDGPDRHAVRRADLGARSGNDQRGARRDGGTRQRRHDHDRGNPRNGLCPQGRQPRRLHGQRRNRRGRADRGLLRQTAQRARTGIFVEDLAAIRSGKCESRTRAVIVLEIKAR